MNRGPVKELLNSTMKPESISILSTKLKYPHCQVTVVDVRKLKIELNVMLNSSVLNQKCDNVSIPKILVTSGRYHSSTGSFYSKTLSLTDLNFRHYQMSWPNAIL